MGTMFTFSSLRKKIVLLFIVTIFITGTLFVYFAHRTGYEMLERQAFARAESVASVVNSILNHLMVSGKHDKLPYVLRNVINTKEVKDVIIVKKDGTVSMHAQAKKEYETFPLDQLRPMTDDHLGKYFSRKTGDLSYLFIAEPLSHKPECYSCHNDAQTVEGFIVVKVEMNDLKIAATRHRTTNIMITSLTFFGIGLVLFIALSIMVIHPIRQLRSHIRLLQREIPKLETKEIEALTVPVTAAITSDEIGDLSEGFTSLVLNLNSAHKKIIDLHAVQLEIADRLANTGEIAASVAHELKNPIAGIMGALQNLKNDYPATDMKHEIILEMISQLERMNHSVNDLLAYARPKPPERIGVRMEDVLERTMTLLTHTFGQKKITIKREDRSQGSTVFVDPKQIQQVLWNILLNSVQSIEEEGTISVVTLKQSSSLVIRVTDTGCGISDEHRTKIFTPFFSTKHTGTGLGLTVCRQIIADHQGFLDIRSNPGAGTEVAFTLPLVINTGDA